MSSPNRGLPTGLKKMRKRNIFETITIISFIGIIIGILLHCVTNISPIVGKWFLIYIATVPTVSVVCSFRLIQRLLSLNRPLKYDLKGFCEKYPYFSFLVVFLPEIPQRRVREYQEYDTNELSVISTVLERRLVSSWYMTYISQEIGFPFACKQMLDQMINKTFQICFKIEIKDVYVDLCAVLVTNLKEYKKALKRHEKSPSTPIETLYKKMHSIHDPANKKYNCADHCTNTIRVILKELVPWELWDTPHSELLVRVLAKKLDNIINTTITDPVWLNDRLIKILTENDCPKPEDTQQSPEKEPAEGKEETHESNEMPLETEKPIAASVESALTNTLNKTSNAAPVLKSSSDRDSEKTLEKTEELPEKSQVSIPSSEPMEIKPVMRQKRGRQGRNEVKIYDRIIEGSVKTWETDMDLQCISVGQDLLASFDEITLSRLWGQEEQEHSPNLRGKSPQPLWFGEEDLAIDLDAAPETSPHKEPKKDTSPKPTDALLKDLQTTVHQAKTKIGDLQVPEHSNIDATRKPSSDEAAGMMEGLLDIGIAGLKKGLRFTGLSDDSQDKSPQPKERGDKISPPEIIRVRPTTDKEDVFNSAPPLVKQHRVTSQDSVPSQARSAVEYSPPLLPLSDSPEPEYEEAADLSATIAKLRSLLQDTSALRAEDIWWEGAEETRGRTHVPHVPHVPHEPHERPVDTATLADEYDMNTDRNSSPNQPNNMQRLDKLLQRTVTGVFNSIRTAVGGEGDDLRHPHPHSRFTYVCAAPDHPVCAAVSRVVGSRRALTHVDAALDSLQQLPPAPPADPHPPPDDFEEWMCACGAAWGGAADVCAALAPPAAPAAHLTHLTHRLAALLFADLGESLIEYWLDEAGAWLRRQVFVEFERAAEDAGPAAAHTDTPAAVDLDQTTALIMEKIPDVYIFSEQAVSEAVKLLLSSFSHQPVTVDVACRALDVLTAHFKNSAGLRNPSFDNN